MPLSTSLRLRAGASFAAAATVATMVPIFTAGSASAAASCTAPGGLSPAGGTSVQESLLSWTPVAGAPGYQLQVSPNADWTNNLYYEGTTNTTNTQVPAGVLQHGAYFWRVRVSGATCWSDTNAQPAQFVYRWADQPNLTFPADGAVLSRDQVRFAWHSGDNNARQHQSEYQIEVSPSPTFPEPGSVQWKGPGYIDCFTTATTWQPNDQIKYPDGVFNTPQENACANSTLPTGVQLYWRVRPLDDFALTADGKPQKEYGIDGIVPSPYGVNVVPTSAATTIKTAYVGFWSNPRTVSLSADADPSTSVLPAPAGVKAGLPDANGSLVSCATCAGTPTISWTTVPGAEGYRVYIASDEDFTTILRTNETQSTSMTLREELPDSQAGGGEGHPYYVGVQACGKSGSGTPCGPIQSNVVTFQKQTAPIKSVATSQPTQGEVTFTWAPFINNSGTDTDAAVYHLEVAKDCAFDANVEDQTVDSYSYTSTSKSYPAGTYYWRVQAVDGSSNPLSWSAPNHAANNCTDAASFIIQAPGNNVSTPGTAISGPVKVDSGAKAIVRSGSWTSAHSSMAYLKNVLVTSGNAHQKLAFTFNNGTSAKVSYCSGPLNGGFTVYLDGKAKKTLNGYKRFVKCGLSVIISGLDKTQTHTISVVANGKKGHTPKGGPRLTIDYFQVA